MGLASQNFVEFHESRNLVFLAVMCISSFPESCLEVYICGRLRRFHSTDLFVCFYTEMTSERLRIGLNVLSSQLKHFEVSVSQF